MSDLYDFSGRWIGFYPRSFAVALGDLDGDGDLDAFVANGHTDDVGEENSVWLNSGSGRFRDSGQRLGNYMSDSRAVALGDVDRDGDLDAVVGNHNGCSTVWLNDGAGIFASTEQTLCVKDHVNGRTMSLGFYAHSVALGDVDADGDLDAFVGECCRISAPGQTTFHEPYNLLWMNDGSGGFTDSGQRLGSLQSHSVALGDVDGDGDLDAFVANGHAAYLGEPNQVWLNDGGGRFTDSGQRLGYPAFNSDDSRAVALGDVDGDGDVDALVGNDGANEIWLNDGSGTLSFSDQELGEGSTQAVFLEDVDGDHDRDAFIANSTAAEIWLNDGAGRFSASSQDIRYSDRDTVTVGDVDGDGDLDVLGMSHDRGCQVWHNDGAAHFSREGYPGRGDWRLLVGGILAVLGSCLLAGWAAWRR